MNHIGEFIETISNLARGDQRRCALGLFMSLLYDPDDYSGVTVLDIVRLTRMPPQQLLKFKIVADTAQVREYLSANNYSLDQSQKNFLAAVEQFQVIDPFQISLNLSGRFPNFVLVGGKPVTTYATAMQMLGIEERIDLPDELFQLIQGKF